MIPEDVKERRGEPVILTYENGTELLGTIEWGDGKRHAFSVYIETGGRQQISRHDVWPKLRSDPGGERPTWRRVSRSP